MSENKKFKRIENFPKKWEKTKPKVSYCWSVLNKKKKLKCTLEEIKGKHRSKTCNEIQKYYSAYLVFLWLLASTEISFTYYYFAPVVSTKLIERIPSHQLHHMIKYHNFSY